MRICNKCMHELDDGTKQCPYCKTWQYVPPTKQQELVNTIVIVLAIIGTFIYFYFRYR